jgi:hypothetical protein
MTYRNMRTGKLEQTSLYDACLNKASEVTLMNNYRFDNGLNWKATLKYDHSRGAMVYQTPMSIIDLKSDANKGVYNYMYRDIDGQTKSYDGQYVQTRMSCLNSGTIDEALFTTELSKKFRTSTFFNDRRTPTLRHTGPNDKKNREVQKNLHHMVYREFGAKSEGISSRGKLC